MSADHGFSLALAFDNDDPMFVCGVEVGRLHEQLKAGDVVEQTVHTANAEMILRLAESHNYTVVAQESGEWLHATFTPEGRSNG